MKDNHTAGSTTQDSAETNAHIAAEAIAAASGALHHDVALITGSGWAGVAEFLGTPDVDLTAKQLTGFEPTMVSGHLGRIRSHTFGGRKILLFLGRIHLYEGYGAGAVVHAVRTAVAAGCGTVILTNAAGGLRADMQVGDLVLIDDHINLTGESPFVGPRFVDLSDLYTRRLRELAKKADAGLTGGIYAALRGPHFETPAEIRMLRALGADLVGMSTALEAIAAHAEGAEVLAISLVTNLAAGMTTSPINHADVFAVGQATLGHMTQLLSKIITRL